MVSFKLSVLFATLFLLPLFNPATCKAFPSFLTSGCLTKLVCSFNFAKTFLNPLKALHQNCFIWTLGRNFISYGTIAIQFSSIQSLSRVQLCNPMDYNMPGFPVYHQLPELTQTHIHGVSDAIQLSHPLSSPSPTFNLSQHQDLFKWISSSHQVTKVLEFQLQHQSFQWIFRTDFL